LIPTTAWKREKEKRKTKGMLKIGERILEIVTFAKKHTSSMKIKLKLFGMLLPREMLKKNLKKLKLKNKQTWNNKRGSQSR